MLQFRLNQEKMSVRGKFIEVPNVDQLSLHIEKDWLIIRIDRVKTLVRWNETVDPRRNRPQLLP